MIEWFDIPIEVGEKPEQEVILDRDVKNYWLGQPSTVPVTPEPLKHGLNPCIALYGPGPEGQTCKGCIHLRYPLGRNPKARHWKCDLRKLTHGPATDHKVNWTACAKYEKREDEYHGG